MQNAIRFGIRHYLSPIASLAVIVSAVLVGRAAIRCTDGLHAHQRGHNRIVDHRESLAIMPAPPTLAPCQSVAESAPPAALQPQGQPSIDPTIVAGIHADGLNHYTIDRRAFEAALSYPQQFAHAARIVPSITHGQPRGFKLYAIKPSSIFAMLGIHNGDTLVAINDLELTSAEKALTVYSTVKATSEFRVTILRQGVELVLTYIITPATSAE